MKNVEKCGAWIGCGLMAAAAILKTGNPWYSLLILWIALAY